MPDIPGVNLKMILNEEAPVEIPPYTFEDLIETIKALPKDNRLIQGDRETLVAWTKLMEEGEVDPDEEIAPLTSFAGIRIRQSTNLPPGTVAFTDGKQIVLWEVDL